MALWVKRRQICNVTLLKDGELRGHVNDAAVFGVVKDFVRSFTKLITKITFKLLVQAIHHVRVLLAFAFATQAAALQKSIATIAKATRDLDYRPNVEVKSRWVEDVTKKQ